MMLLDTLPQTILEKVPEAAGGRALVLQEGDDPERDFPQAGRYGLMSHLDDCWQEPFAWVRVITIRGSRMFVARLARNYRKGTHAVVVPDAPWVDSRLRLVLEMEGEEAGAEG